MKILIIGGTGLISTPLTRFLQERGDEVVHANRGNTAARVSVPTITVDRKEYPAFEARLAQEDPFDCVIDMVAFLPADVESAIRAFKGRAGQYIFCSTVDVYTKPAAHYPITEDAERQPAPSFPYAFHKARCEEILETAHERGELAVTIIRPAHTYGEGGALLHSFGWDTAYIDRIRRGLPVVVHGDGSSLWSSCHIDDVARAFVAAVGKAETFGRAYHVTGEEWMPWNTYHRRVAEALDAPLPQLVHIPTDLLAQALPEQAKWCLENFQFNNIFDNSIARADLYFQYTVPWVEGVKRTVAWLDAQNRINPAESDQLTDRLVTAWQSLKPTFVQTMGV